MENEVISQTLTTATAPEFLSHEDLAHLLNLPLKAVRKYSYLRRIPGRIAIGSRCVRYRKSDVMLALNSGSLLLKRGS